MKNYIVDYICPDGRRDFKCVTASSKSEALVTFKAAGIDGWSGYSFADCTVTAVTER